MNVIHLQVLADHHSGFEDVVQSYSFRLAGTGGSGGSAADRLGHLAALALLKGTVQDSRSSTRNPQVEK